MNKTELVHRFQMIVMGELDAANIDTTIPRQHAFLDFIREGANKLEFEANSKLIPKFEEDKMIGIAEGNLRMFVREAIRELENSSKNTLDTTTIDIIRKRLCPLHPFC